MCYIELSCNVEVTGLQSLISSACPVQGAKCCCGHLHKTTFRHAVDTRNFHC